VVAGLTGEDGDLVRRLSSAFLDGLLEVLGEKLFALYFYGAVAFPETQALGDIDFHAILGARLSDGERRALVELHERLASDFPPLGGELDGYYLLLEEARRSAPPRDELRPDKIDGSFALHCAPPRRPLDRPLRPGSQGRLPRALLDGP